MANYRQILSQSSSSAKLLTPQQQMMPLSKWGCLDEYGRAMQQWLLCSLECLKIVLESFNTAFAISFLASIWIFVFPRFGSWTFESYEVDVDLAFPDGIDLSTFQSDYKESSGWEITKTSAEKRILPSLNETPHYSVVQFQVTGQIY